MSYDDARRDQSRMVKLTTVYERVSAAGRRYFSGVIGDAQLLMFRGPDTDEGQPTWKLLVQERDPSRRPPAQAQRHEAGGYHRTPQDSPPEGRPQNRPPEGRPRERAGPQSNAPDPWAPDDDLDDGIAF